MTENNFDDGPFFEEYVKLRGRWPNYNDLIEQPAMRRLLPDLKGKTIIDLGCGYGSNCVEFVHRGAREVVGIDISKRMLEKAMEQNPSPLVEYKLMDLKDISTIGSTFDLAYSSLAFHYVEDFEGLMEGIYHSLNEGGHLLFSQEHPSTTAPLKSDLVWISDEYGIREAYRLSDYMLPGLRNTTWLGKEIHKFHRPFSTILNAITRCGFLIEEIQEPLPDGAAVDLCPDMAKEIHLPSFLIVRAKKP